MVASPFKCHFTKEFQRVIHAYFSFSYLFKYRKVISRLIKEKIYSEFILQSRGVAFRNRENLRSDSWQASQKLFKKCFSFIERNKVCWKELGTRKWNKRQNEYLRRSFTLRLACFSKGILVDWSWGWAEVRDLGQEENLIQCVVNRYFVPIDHGKAVNHMSNKDVNLKDLCLSLL